MNQCTEFAVFRVTSENIKKAVALSEAIFAEMNAEKTVITAYQVLHKTDDPEEICWHLTWVNAEVAQTTTAKWPTFSSTAAFQALVVKDVYYGHFVDVI